MRAGVYGRQSQGHKKSIEDQMELGHELCLERDWLERVYSDKVSASWFGTKQRGGWDEVLADLDAGELDVLVLWESSRGDRRNTEWSRMLDTCVDRGVLLHIIEHERTYDPRIPRDWETLASEGIKSQAEVLKLSGRVRRGVARSAKNGRPAAGPAPYGYCRTYDPASGALVGQEPDSETAPIVREIIAQVAASVPLGTVAKNLNDRGVVPPGAKSPNGQKSAKWYRERIRRIAENRTYLGERKHKDKWHPAGWESLTDPVTFAAAGRVLSAPGRSKHGADSRPGKQTHLLTGLAVCAICGEGVRARGSEERGTVKVYVCYRGHVQIERAPVDELIRELAIARLSAEDAYAALVQPGEAADEDLQAYEEERSALAQRLDAVRLSARRGATSLESLAVIESGLTEDIEALAKKIEAARTPAALAGWVGPEVDVTARWDSAPVTARRVVIRAIGLRIALQPVGRNRYAEITDRVVVEWQ